MKYIIGERIFESFPAYARGLVVARNVTNLGNSAQLSELLTEESARAAIQIQALLESTRTVIWDDIYRKFGANPNQNTPSIKFLLQQIQRGRPPRSINPLVDIFNIMSIRFQIPCGGDDLDSLDGGSARLDFASGNESFAPLFKPERIEHPTAGEVIYLESSTTRVMCRRWNWRNAHFSRIRPETTNVAINLDAMIPPVPRTDLESACNQMADLIRQFCRGQITTIILDSARAVANI